MQVLYALEMGCGTVADALTAAIDGVKLLPDQQKYAVQLIDLSLSQREENRKEIGEALSNWDYERVAAIDRLLLEIGLTEIKHFVEVPPKVILSEYQSIAKKFSTEESARFVGGLINVLIRRYVQMDTANRGDVDE
jgi:N utilization substance protein B